MTPNEFVYWLQGYVELNGGTPTDSQWVVIKDHLQLVMDKKTPVRIEPVEPFELRRSDFPIPFWTSPDLFNKTKITC